uniref:SPRY domain-containing protein 7 n=1 Tax=Gasterosteus aculeatus aculeatus TaxID=481459 RepID=A0AAQ4PKY3_GASAC
MLRIEKAVAEAGEKKPRALKNDNCAFRERTRVISKRKRSVSRQDRTSALCQLFTREAALQTPPSLAGTDVVIVKSGRRICGTGGCLANAPLHQNKSYFEFKIQSTGVWGIGVATQKVNLNQVPMGRDTNSLVLRSDGSVYHNNEEKNRLPANSLPQEGDIVGVTYDHVELNLYLNGKNMHCPASGIRGTVYPVVYVDDSAILDCQFSDFYHTAPPGFEKILFEQQIF